MRIFLGKYENKIHMFTNTMHITHKRINTSNLPAAALHYPCVPKSLIKEFVKDRPIRVTGSLKNQNYCLHEENTRHHENRFPKTISPSPFQGHCCHSLTRTPGRSSQGPSSVQPIRRSGSKGS